MVSSSRTRTGQRWRKPKPVFDDRFSRSNVARQKAIQRIDAEIRDEHREFYTGEFTNTPTEIFDEAVNREMRRRGAGAEYILEWWQLRS